MILTILDDVAETFWKIIISLVGSIFKLVNSAYRIFLALAEADIFKNAEFDIITKNMYEILSIVMLFALAYGILNRSLKFRMRLNIILKQYLNGSTKASS